MRIVFMGTPQAAVPTLSRCVADGHEVLAVYTQPDRPSGRGQKVVASPVKQEAERLGIRILQPTSLRIPESLDTFRSVNADIAVVVAYGRILPAAYLSAFEHGAVNVHFSLLPKYRGAAPVNWAIAHGETVTGVTTMLMDEGLDTGDILLQSETAIGGDETSIDLTSRLAELGAGLLSGTLAGLASIKPAKQDDSRATYAPILRKEDGVIDWNSPAASIVNRVRGFQPFPGSFTYLNGTKLNLWKCREVSGASTGEAQPGVVRSVERDGIVVGCGDGTSLVIDEIQVPGKRRMSVRDFLNGSKLDVGDRFENE